MTINPVYDKDFGIGNASKEHVVELLEAAQDSLVKLIRERKRLDWRINETSKDILHLCAVVGIQMDDPLKQLGITDAIRSIVGLSGKPISPVEIKEKLKDAEIELPESNPLGPVHTILKRLEKSGEIRRVQIVEGVNGYEWIGGLPPPPTFPKWLTEEMPKKKGSLMAELNKKAKKLKK